MDKSLAIREITQFITESILDSDIRLEPQTSLREAGVDSFATVEIMLFIERHFGINIPVDELLPANFESVDALADMAEKLVNQ